jgi:hypothetical protein
MENEAIFARRSKKSCEIRNLEDLVVAFQRQNHYRGRSVLTICNDPGISQKPGKNCDFWSARGLPEMH